MKEDRAKRIYGKVYELTNVALPDETNNDASELINTLASGHAPIYACAELVILQLGLL